MLILLCVIGSIYFIFTNRNNDTRPPEISMEEEILKLSVSDPENKLLQGVSVRDDRDGDVTHLLVVEKISELTADHTATVTYAAFDLAGNVSKASRTILYTDYTSPVFGLKSPLVFTVGTNVNVLNQVTATDMLDGDISRNLKANLVGESTGLNTEGTHQVNFRVTNSMGETARITLPVDVLPANTYRGTIQLTDNMIYLKKGDRFRAEDYFESITVGVTKFTPEDDVELELTVTDDVDTSVPGVYSAAYTAQFNTTQAFTRLIVVVEE